MNEELTLTERKRREYAKTLLELVSAARDDGFVLSIETVHIEPLSMGRYGLLCEARLANELYRVDA